MKDNENIDESCVCFQHVILALKLGIAYAIPDVPQWVAEEKARLEYHRREAFKVGENRKFLTYVT